ncbi:MAG: TetR/AcrR family transcriptional regulator [Rhodobacteraceae bacterium]|nr:TetR/AcrR family transcriptional regulator [Paracoccaceae bacterium]
MAEQKRPPRGRPQRTEKQIAEMRAKISARALRLFQEEGYEAISMRRLAKEAGLTPMTLYKYFDSKIDILRSLWAGIFGELFIDLEKIAAREPDPQARIHAVSLRYVTYWLDSPDHYFMVFMSKGISQLDVRGFVEADATLAWFYVLRDSLSAALGDGVEPPVKRLKSELLLCILNGIAHNLITISSYPWSDHEDLVRTAIDGLLPKNPSDAPICGDAC